MAKQLDKLPAPDLTLLRKLVSQLEEGLETCEKIKHDENSSLADFVVEMSKATGLLTGIVQESSMLVGDIQALVRASQQPQSTQAKNPDFLEKILGGLKGAGGNFN